MQHCGERVNKGFLGHLQYMEGVVRLVMHAILNEYQKWFGHDAILWDFMYRACDYREKMLSPSQRARYVSIKDLLAMHFPQKAALLDVGCGVANSIDFWYPSLSSYHGVDISQAAVQKARATYKGNDLSVSFEVVSMQDLDCRGRSFDAIVFNESLYYVPCVQEAVDMVQKGCSMLTEHGRLIVSMSDSRRAGEIWTALAAAPPRCISKERVESSDGNAWHIAVYAPTNRSQQHTCLN
mmetsp:Transcript_168377/g.540960  ORF Transcript_168377/g.540960 Transcript_168377/m.540960 type:complete len:238 (-) Transcript_168377:190-903(-)